MEIPKFRLRRKKEYIADPYVAEHERRIAQAEAQQEEYTKRGSFVLSKIANFDSLGLDYDQLQQVASYVGISIFETDHRDHRDSLGRREATDEEIEKWLALSLVYGDMHSNIKKQLLEEDKRVATLTQLAGSIIQFDVLYQFTHFEEATALPQDWYDIWSGRINSLNSPS